MVPSLTAVILHRELRSGRTKPAVFGCIDSAGHSAGDYVVKLSGGMDTGPRGAACELIASLLARHFGIQHPPPAIVELHPDLVNWLRSRRPDLSSSISRSPGLNFATELLTDVSTLPVGRPIPDAMLPPATRIFAFDALISNDDRRRDNPNLLVRGDEIFVIDHEAAFSFLYLISTGEASWQVRNRRSLTNHPFFFQLRGRAIDLRLFIARLASLGDSQLEALIRAVPVEWMQDNLARISTHLQAVRDHATVFERELLERLL